jgi:hypothetical protein
MVSSLTVAYRTQRISGNAIQTSPIVLNPQAGPVCLQTLG